MDPRIQQRVDHMAHNGYELVANDQNLAIVHQNGVYLAIYVHNGNVIVRPAPRDRSHWPSSTVSVQSIAGNIIEPSPPVANSAQPNTKKVSYWMAGCAVVLGICVVLAAIGSFAYRGADDSDAPRSYTTDAARILAQRPFAPTDREMFNHIAYPELPIHTPALMPNLTEEDLLEQIERDLRQYLTARYGISEEETIDELVALYYDLTNGNDRVEYIDPILAASIVALSGTVSEPALQDIQNGSYQWIGFGATSNEDFTAEVIIRNDGTRVIIVDARLRFEHFLLITSMIAHEVMHRDCEDPLYASCGQNAVSIAEETFAYFVSTVTYMQIIQLTPSLATHDGVFAPLHNTAVLSLLNSSDSASSGVSILSSDTNVFPNGSDVGNFADYVAHIYRDYNLNSIGNEVAVQVAENIASSALVVPDNLTFRSLVEAVDRSGVDSAILSPEDLIEIACILKLDVPGGC